MEPLDLRPLTLVVESDNRFEIDVDFLLRVAPGLKLAPF